MMVLGRYNDYGFQGSPISLVPARDHAVSIKEGRGIDSEIGDP